MEERELIDLTDIFDRLFKSLKKLWKICIICIIVCIGVFELKTLLTYHPTYTSSMTVVMASQEDILVTDDNTEQTMSSFQNALTSSAMQNVICEDLGLSYIPASLNVSLVPNTNFLVISSTSSQSEDAYNVVNSISNHYGQLTKLMNDADMIIIEKPKKAITPDVTPSYLTEGIKGAIIGIFICIVLICLHSLTKRTLYKEEHIQKKLHLKCLTSIPFISIKKSSYQHKSELFVTNPRIPASFKNSFHSLTMAIQREKNKKVFMITSTLPNEGKSTISLNTALMLSKEGKKVVLLDLDLRNPSLYRLLNDKEIPYQIGEYLDGKASLKDIIIHDQDMNIDMILGTQSFENSISMLSGHYLSALIKELKQLYDYVIIDVPPLLIMQDALIVAKYSDSTLIVIKQDYAKTYEIMDAIDELYEIDRHIIGCVFNCVEKSIFDKMSSSYGYGYGYGYGK